VGRIQFDHEYPTKLSRVLPAGGAGHRRTGYEHRPSFLRPDLHLSAQIATADGVTVVLSLAGWAKKGEERFLTAQADAFAGAKAKEKVCLLRSE